MRIEFVRQHGVYLPGQIVDHPHDGVSDVLICRGIARLADGIAAAVETEKTSEAKPKAQKPKAQKPKAQKPR